MPKIFLIILTPLILIMALVSYSYGTGKDPMSTVSKILVRPTPTSTPIPIPTTDPDPIITCYWEKINNKETCPSKQMRKSACNDSICCGLYNGTYSSMSKVECAEFQAKYKPPAVQRVQVPLPQYNPPKMPQTTNCRTVGFGQFATVTCTTY